MLDIAINIDQQIEYSTCGTPLSKNERGGGGAKHSPPFWDASLFAAVPCLRMAHSSRCHRHLLISLLRLEARLEPRIEQGLSQVNERSKQKPDKLKLRFEQWSCIIMVCYETGRRRK